MADFAVADDIYERGLTGTQSAFEGRTKFLRSRDMLAMTIHELGEALNLLNGEYAAPGKGATFQALKAFLDPIDTKDVPSYEEAAALLKVSVASAMAKTLIYRLRKAVYRFCPGGDQLHRFELR